jgi:aerobic carbon-monoxide dehydrogenase large subunit
MLFEEVVYDPESGQNLTGSYMDYLLATSVEVPWFEVNHLENLNPNTPLGAKGMAEGGVMGATAAIGNAVADALAPYGISVDRQPFTPSRILDWLIEAGAIEPV